MHVIISGFVLVAFWLKFYVPILVCANIPSDIKELTILYGSGAVLIHL